MYLKFWAGSDIFRWIWINTHIYATLNTSHNHTIIGEFISYNQKGDNGILFLFLLALWGNILLWCPGHILIWIQKIEHMGCSSLYESIVRLITIVNDY